MRFQEKLARFMDGRYGVDSLYYALLVLYLVLLVLNLFVRLWPLTLLMWVVVGYAFFRVLSRNTARRRAENAWFIGWWDPVRRWGRLTKRRFAERRTHAYKTCPHCRAVVRLARVKGQHTCTCPRCRQDFAVRM